MSIGIKECRHPHLLSFQLSTEGLCAFFSLNSGLWWLEVLAPKGNGLFHRTPIVLLNYKLKLVCGTSNYASQE